jgi:hypothetical protein
MRGKRRAHRCRYMKINDAPASNLRRFAKS